ncbi:xanthine dehydrogenase family protein molybdopterin-binding subunit [Pelagibius sp. Alg239-R121]|uniref:xanthine dehydrogenase family protein molybdopterin-binding subunit n=1 Tax=Pelagibius sp. Alg239-R121 TaxID=2993448 RepID=UPI0024A626C8|nr:xanthine dehydrogenase family protein molybdopterin-binding subunit [Pelagibius sp. Alg239-R121]
MIGPDPQLQATERGPDPITDTPAASDDAPIGQAIKRQEDERLLRGAGRYTDDVTIEDALHIIFVRSPFPCGRITELECGEARSLPGVLAVYCGADVVDLGELPVNPLLAEVNAPRYPLLARGKVMAVGEPVAAVIATSSMIAQDAAELVILEVDEDSAIMSIADSKIGGDLFKDIPGNRALHQVWQSGETEKIFDEAPFVVEARLTHPRLSPTSIEPRTTAASWDERAESLTVWLSSQTPHRARKDLATIMGLSPDSIRVVSPDVGGAFGMKASLYPEDIMVAWAAWQLKQPVRWTAARSEDLLSGTHGRGAETAGKLAINSEGSFLGLSAQIDVPLGHWLPHSGAVPAWNSGRILPGPYDIDSADIEVAGFLTNSAPVGIYRGAGRPEAAALMERLVEEAARATGIDPLEIRLRNLLPASRLPHEGPTGTKLDSGDYRACLERLCNIAGYPALRRNQDSRRQQGEICGIGLACYVEPCGQGWESARVTLASDGSISAATGTSSQGHGRETAFAQIVASVFGLAAEDVAIRHGDTSTAPKGIGALASRSTAIGGSALLCAARELRDETCNIAAIQLDTHSENLRLTRAGFCRKDAPDRTATWTAIAGPAGLQKDSVYSVEGEAWGYGAYLAVVAIDAETGVLTVEHIYCVDDAGTIVNPLLVEGQILGGIAQGLGEALMEQIVYDKNGQLLTGSLTDYAVPRASDMVPVTLDKLITPSPFNILGAKGVGEAGTIGTPAAILNATLDALSPFGVTRLDMPLTSEKIWRALHDAGN